MEQKDLNKDFEQAAMCNSQDLTRSQVCLWFVFVKLKRTWGSWAIKWQNMIPQVFLLKKLLLSMYV
jgi:hypothetical protein